MVAPQKGSSNHCPTQDSDGERDSECVVCGGLGDMGSPIKNRRLIPLPLPQTPLYSAPHPRHTDCYIMGFYVPLLAILGAFLFLIAIIPQLYTLALLS